MFSNPFDEIIFYLKRMIEVGVRPELQVFDTGHLASLEPLIDMGLLKPPYDVNLVMGVMGGMPASAAMLSFIVSQMPVGAIWKTTPISHLTWRMTALSLGSGGNVRVGLEDNFYLPGGEMVKSNGDLVAHAAKIARAAGRTTATPDEARTLLGLA